MATLVTGSAGFIGFHTAKRLLEEGETVIGVDNFNDYYDISLKESRNSILEKFPNFKLYRVDITGSLAKVFEHNQIESIVHLAAQAGVRFSFVNPSLYINSNINGTLNIFELGRKHKVTNIVYASSSSVYGGNKKIPFSENDMLENPISVYAMTKRCNELMAPIYHDNYGLKITGLRFFTVYGPWGRPDMALWKFTENILRGKPIEVYNYGNMQRGFTYIHDAVEGTIKALKKEYDNEIINIGNNKPIELNHLISLIEEITGKKAVKKMLPMQPGDAPITCADITKAKRLLDWKPTTDIEEGVKEFVKWYKNRTNVL